MLKGHVFKNQYFGNPIFALFINTFLNGKNGVSSDYENSMEVTYNGSEITVDSGAICIQGRFLEEDTTTTLDVGTDDSYCKLVIEIDLDKNNTDVEFNQGYYKILTNSMDYPELTQENIIKNNAGVYQYELARFTTSINGIANFVDKRTFLDFESIYTALQTEYRSVLEELRQELENIEDRSAFVLKDNIVTIFGTIQMPEANDENLTGITYVNYPNGFNKDNCIIIGLMSHNTSHTDYWSTPMSSESISSAQLGNGNLMATLTSDNIRVRSDKSNAAMPRKDVTFKLALLKYEPDVSDYELGDVNMNGEVFEEDLTLLNSYLAGNTTLTGKQFKLADMNSDGAVDSTDAGLLNQKISDENS